MPRGSYDLETEIRPITEAERARRDFVFRTAFALPDRFTASPEPADLHGSERTDRWLAAFANGEMAACMLTLPLVTWINGAPIPLGGVSAVSSLPEYRRLGLTGAMLRRALADMRDRGEVLSGLFTPHVPLYTSFGWEPASQNLSHSFATKQIALRRSLAPAGHYVRTSPDDWRRLDAAWRRFIADPVLSNCQIERDEQWWRAVVFNERNGAAGRDLVAWADEHDEWQGWLCFREDDLRPAVYGTRLNVRELVALTPAAMQQLTAFLLRHDRAVEVSYFTSDDGVLRTMLADPTPVKSALRERLLLRVVDLPAAVSLRPSATGQPARVTLAIEDRDAPWNAGTWRIEAKNGHIQAAVTGDAAQAAMSINTFATLFNGYHDAGQAARAGTLEVRDRAVIGALDAIFAVAARPQIIDGF